MPELYQDGHALRPSDLAHHNHVALQTLVCTGCEEVAVATLPQILQAWSAAMAHEQYLLDGKSEHGHASNSPVSPDGSESSLLDSPRMDGQQWIAPTDEECDAWPVWESTDMADRQIFLSGAQVRAKVRMYPSYRPLRLPGMNERGEVVARDMTQTHIDRVKEWQWRPADKWQSEEWITPAELWFPEDMAAGGLWRPAVFAQFVP